MEVVAVLGGGQLGLMLGLAGVPLGARFRFLDPAGAAPAQAVGSLRVAGLDDPAAALELAHGASAVTYEWEGVPATTVQHLSDAGVTVRPGVASLAGSQDRLHEKQRFERLGIGVARFAPVDDLPSLLAACEHTGLPAILKTRTGGYDGKGQVVIRSRADAEAALAELPAGAALILEQLVSFDRELSIIAVRAADGELACWPLVENHHERGILRTTRAPAPDVDAALTALAEQMVRALAEDVDHVGVIALELFQVGDALLANEYAPRVHNSGHWSIEGAETSQFENHVRAVLGWPLGPTGARAEAAMVNCIGRLPDPSAVLGLPGVHLHRYGKAPRPGRKVGHLTVTAPDPSTLDDRLRALRAVLPADDG